MILRIWHGWTAPGEADAYEGLLKDEIFAGIGARRIEGYHGIPYPEMLCERLTVPVFRISICYRQRSVPPRAGQSLEIVVHDDHAVTIQSNAAGPEFPDPPGAIPEDAGPPVSKDEILFDPVPVPVPER